MKERQKNFTFLLKVQKETLAILVIDVVFFHVLPTTPLRTSLATFGLDDTLYD